MDENPKKINLGVGAYRNNEGQPQVLQAVREAENRLNGSENHEYLPISGLASFNDASMKLVLGSKVSHCAIVQTISGTGALRIAAELIRKVNPSATIFISDPTWANHNGIFQAAQLKVQTYRYYSKSTMAVDFDGMVQDVDQAPDGSVFVLHACAHNPTGVDLSEAQWKTLASHIQRKNHLCLFDNAYQGFASGDLEKDAFAIRLFFNELKMKGFVASSYSKNFGLYCERVGSLIAACQDEGEAKAVHSQMCRVSRTMVSNCPAYGARIVSSILCDPTLYKMWEAELLGMSTRILDMRKLLRQGLEKRQVKGSWQHITDQIGMFSFTGLTPSHVQVLKDTYSIYMTNNGRISMCGLTTDNMEYFCDAVKTVLE